MAAKGTEQTFITLQSKTTGAWLVHPDLRPRMVQEAQEKQTNLTDLTAEILSQHFGIPYAPQRRRSTADSDQRLLNVGIPPRLDRALRAAYKSRMDGIREILCAHYGLDVPPKVKQTRRRAAAAA